MKYKATLIIPIHISKHRKDIFEKVLNIIKKSSFKYEYIFVCSESSRKNFTKIQNSFENVNFFFLDMPEVEINVSKLRNLGISKASAELIIFIDVDIYFNESFLDKWCRAFKEEGNSVVPCIYLSENGWKLLRSSGVDAVLDKFFKLDKRYYLHLALFSFVFIVYTKDVKERGLVFDENYYGHGYEDFDFVLNNFSDDIKKFSDVGFLDNASLILSSGFKVWLGRIGYKNYLMNNICFHLPHSKSKTYTLDRERNKKYFFEKNKDLLTKGSTGADFFKEIFLDYSQEKIDINHIKPILDLRRGHEGRYRTFISKLKFTMGF